MSYTTKQLLGLAIDELWQTLHLKSRSQLWEYADVDRHQWYRLLRLNYKQLPTTQNIAELISNLQERDFKVPPELEKQLYLALGVTIKEEKGAGVIPTPPPSPDYFGGRENSLEQLKARLTGEQQSSTLAVYGLGGIGKTTLARKLAHDLFYQDKAVRAVLWAELTRQPDPLNILLSWAFYANPAFHYNNQPLPQLALQVKALLENLLIAQADPTRPDRILVVLDDIWDNGKEAARLLRQACPANATILMTTRSQNLAVELVGAQGEPLDQLKQAEGVRLLQIYLPEADPAVLAELVQVLGGHPLALNLAARRVLKKTNQAKALQEQLTQYRQGLKAGSSLAELGMESGSDREDNLTVVFSHSYAALSSDHQARFRALGIFAYDQPFDTKLLAALWQVEQAQVEHLTDELRLAALLEIAPQYGEGWYRQHALLQAYAHSLVQSGSDYATLQDRYDEYLVSLTRQFDQLGVERWHEIRPYLAHIHGLGNQLVKAVAEELDKAKTAPTDSLFEKALRFAKNTSYYLLKWGEIHQLDWLEMGLAVAKALPNRSGEAYFLNVIGQDYATRGKIALGKNYCQNALTIFQELGEVENEIGCLNNLALLCNKVGERQTALDYALKALPLVQKLENQKLEAEVLNSVGMAYSYLDNHQFALEYLFRALAVRKDLRDIYAEAPLLNNIGATYSRMQNYSQALRYCQQSLELRRVIGDLNGQATALLNSAFALAKLGQPEKALEYHQQALDLNHKIGDELGQAIIIGHIGKVYAELGQPQLALEYLEKSKIQLGELGHLVRKASTCYHIGKIYEEQGNLPEALKYYLEATDLPENNGHNLEEAQRMYDLGRLYQKLGLFDVAYHWIERSIAVAVMVKSDKLETYKAALNLK